MGRNERAERVRRGLHTVWDAGARAFLTIEGLDDPELFVQFLDGQLNVAWPLDSDPGDELPRLGARPPAGARLLSWSAHGAALFHTGDLRVDELAAWIDVLLERVLDVWDIEVRVEADR